eukprot:10198891-Alexandrium_andersonii.AAC.1
MLEGLCQPWRAARAPSSPLTGPESNSARAPRGLKARGLRSRARRPGEARRAPQISGSGGSE